jgi:aminoglycoside phosphotransferase (APT) family kinase protein
MRAEGPFDPARLLSFLRAQIPELPAGKIQLEPFDGGASHLNDLLTVDAREFVLRRSAPVTNPQSSGSAKNPNDANSLRREMRVLGALASHFPCPRPLAYCEDESLIGSRFMLMEKLNGIILRHDLPAGLKLAPEQARRACLNLFDTLQDLHQLDVAALQLIDLGQPQGYVTRQISGWCARYENAWTDDVPRCESLRQWLRQKTPADSSRPGLIHNDYRFDNVVLSADDGTRMIGVLDWETCTIGDPLMDLGNTLAGWVQADDPASLQKIRMQPSHLPGMLTRDEIVERYAIRSGVRIDNFDFYYAFGLFRQAVLAQQYYHRFKRKPQAYSRFAAFGLLASIFIRSAERVISRSRL